MFETDSTPIILRMKRSYANKTFKFTEPIRHTSDVGWKATKMKSTCILAQQFPPINSKRIPFKLIGKLKILILCISYNDTAITIT